MTTISLPHRTLAVHVSRSVDPVLARAAAAALAYIVASSIFIGLQLAGALPARAAQAKAAFEAADPGWLVTAPDNVSIAERFVLHEDLVPFLRGTVVGEEVQLTDFPVAPGLRRGVRLTRRDVYAPGAVVWRVDGSGPKEVPRSRLVFLWGETEDAARSRVLAIVDPDRGTLRSFSANEDGWSVVEPDPESPGAYRVVPSRSLLGGVEDRLTRECGEESLDPVPPSGPPAASPVDPWSGTPSQPGAPPASGMAIPSESTASAASAGTTLTTAALTSMHDATIAVDTDNEFLSQKFANDTTAATNYIASLLAFVSAIYERDLLVRIRQGTTYLRVSTTADPWAQSGTGNADSAKLNELRTYWSATYGAVPRATTILLSGKQSSGYSSSGIAYVDALCNKSYDYAFIQVFKYSGSTASSDVMVTAHEIGHNFGSKHTHCYLTPTPIDTCYASETSCYSGATSCPSAQTINGLTNVRGTLMSYCHQLSGCGLSNVFHPRTVGIINPILTTKAGVCISPSAAPAPPSEASGAGQMRVRKGTGSALTVTYAAACGAATHTIYAGTFPISRSQGPVWSQRYCSQGISGTASFTPAGGSQYFVIVGNDGAIEGSYGRASSGSERPAAGSGGSCAYTLQLGGTCP